MKKALKYFFAKNNNRIIRKLNGYQILTEKMVNFSTLVPAIYEAREDFDEILCLLLGGHYKSCLLLLRSHFELKNGIIRAIKDNQPTTSFYKKRESEEERKFLTKSLEIEKDWVIQLTDLYNKLSKFVHSTGKSSSHKTLVSLPQPTFAKKSFDFCLDLINQVIDHNAGLLKFCFNPTYWKQDLLKNIFGKDFAANYETTYADQCIEYLYKNIDNELVNKNLNKKAQLVTKDSG